MTSSNHDPERIYAVRFSSIADQDITEAFLRMADISESEDVAREWLQGVREAIATLATQPNRSQIEAQVSRYMGSNVRRLLYRRTNSTSVAHHIYYRVYEESDDGPFVRVLHVRHASRKPITRKEAREIQASE
jgi:plasmid stabilization system protein ParE